MLNPEQLNKLSKIFEKEILPVIQAHPKEFEEISKRTKEVLKKKKC